MLKITGKNQKIEVGLLPLNAPFDSIATITFADVGFVSRYQTFSEISANHDFGGLKWPKFRASLSEPSDSLKLLNFVDNCSPLNS